jgi:hypothetical protein
MLPITPPMNPRSTTLEVSMLAITPPEPTIYHTRGEHANHYTTNAFIFWLEKK